MVIFRQQKKISLDDFGLLSFFLRHLHVKYSRRKIASRATGFIFPTFWPFIKGLKWSKNARLKGNLLPGSQSALVIARIVQSGHGICQNLHETTAVLMTPHFVLCDAYETLRFQYVQRRICLTHPVDAILGFFFYFFVFCICTLFLSLNPFL